MMLTLRFGGFFRLGRGSGLWARLLDLQLVAHENGFIRLHDGLVSLVLVGHLHETVAFRASRLMVHDDLAGFYSAELFE